MLDICSRTSSFRGNLNRGSHSGWKNSFVREALAISTITTCPEGFHGTSIYRGHLEESEGKWVNKPDRLWVEIQDPPNELVLLGSTHYRLNKQLLILKQMIHQCIILVNDPQRRLDFVKDNKCLSHRWLG